MTNISRRSFLSGAAALSAAIALAGCSTTQPGSGDADSAVGPLSPADMKIEFITTAPSELTSGQVDAMQARANELGVGNFSAQYYNTNVATETSLIENAVQSGVNCIILLNQSSDDCVDALNDAVKAGVVVLLYAIAVPDVAYTVLYAENNEECGQMEAKMAADWVNKNLVANNIPVKYAVGTYSISEIAVNRAKGSHEKFAELVPGAEFLGEIEGAYKEEGLTEGENLLQIHPDVNVILGLNDQSALGVMEALVAGGKKAEDVAIFGMDGSADGMRAIAEGSMFRGTVLVPTNEAGVTLVEAAVDILTGNSDFEIGGQAQEGLELVLVTEENVNDYKEIWDTQA